MKIEKHRRTITKAVTYRMFATLTVFTVAFLYTGKLGSSMKIGGTTAIAKTFLYYAWERLWSNIGWGLKS
ncbi:MAG: DUF2061 domain-containing protein [Candidatus Nanohaloarchaea archaeon]